MCPISNIVPVEFVRMPGGGYGGSRSLGLIRIIRRINMLLKGGGVRKIRITGSITEPHIPTIAKETVRNKNHATANAPKAVWGSAR
jgi:hypothetical protein